MGFYYTKQVTIDPKEIEILDENKDFFWKHHGRCEEDKEYLRHLAHILPEIIEKQQNGIELNDEEKYSYNIFIKNGPIVEYDGVMQKYTIIDGRHRMYMLREEDIPLKMDVNFYEISYEEKVRRREIAMYCPPQQEQKNYFSELVESLRDYKITPRKPTILIVG